MLIANASHLRGSMFGRQGRRPGQNHWRWRQPVGGLQAFSTAHATTRTRHTGKRSMPAPHLTCSKISNLGANCSNQNTPSIQAVSQCGWMTVG